MDSFKFCTENSLCESDKYGVSIVYAYQDSDAFYNARLCKYNINCMCFETEAPIKTGENIYIMIHVYPVDGKSLEIYEGCLALVERCDQSHKRGNSFFVVRAREILPKHI